MTVVGYVQELSFFVLRTIIEPADFVDALIVMCAMFNKFSTTYRSEPSKDECANAISHGGSLGIYDFVDGEVLGTLPLTGYRNEWSSDTRSTEIDDV